MYLASPGQVASLSKPEARLPLGDVPSILSSGAVWSPILPIEEIGREEAIQRRADHRVSEAGRRRLGGQRVVPQHPLSTWYMGSSATTTAISRCFYADGLSGFL